MESNTKDLEGYIRTKKNNLKTKLLKTASGVLATATILGALASCEKNVPVGPVDDSSRTVTSEPVYSNITTDITTNPNSDITTPDTDKPKPIYPDFETPYGVLKGFDPEEKPIEECVGEEKIVKFLYDYTGQYVRSLGVVLFKTYDFDTNKYFTNVSFKSIHDGVVGIVRYDIAVVADASLYDTCNKLMGDTAKNGVLDILWAGNKDLEEEVCNIVCSSLKEAHGDKTLKQEQEEEASKPQPSIETMTNAQKLDLVNKAYCIKNNFTSEDFPRNLPYNITEIRLNQKSDTGEQVAIMRVKGNYRWTLFPAVVHYADGSEMASYSVVFISPTTFDLNVGNELFEEVKKLVPSDNEQIVLERTSDNIDQYEQVAKIIYDYVSTHNPEYSPESEMQR